MSRDWAKTLWAASFKGVPFFVEHDDEDGGRRLAIHEYPHSDNPDIEDLGQRAKSFVVVAYLVGDTSDGDASTLSATFDGDGPGTLVLPITGPVANCYCDKFRRSRSKDKLGYIAYDATFYRGGASTSGFTSPYLAQLAYDAITNLSMAAQDSTSQISTSGPAYIADDVIAGLQDNVAALEALQSQASIATSSAAAISTQLSTLYNSIPSRVSQ